MELIEPHFPTEEDKSQEESKILDEPDSDAPSLLPARPSCPHSVDPESLTSDSPNRSHSSQNRLSGFKANLELCLSKFYMCLHKNLCRYYLIMMLSNFYLFLFRVVSSEVFIVDFFLVTLIFFIVKVNPPQGLVMEQMEQEEARANSLMNMVINQGNRGRNWRLQGLNADPEANSYSGLERRSRRSNQLRINQVDHQRLIRARILQILSQRHRNLQGELVLSGQRDEGSTLPLFLQIIQMQEDERWINDMINMVRENSGRHGMSDNEIEEIPVQKFHAVDGAYEADSCSICLESFSEDSDCKVLSCHHLYHAPCISQWLKLSKECPVCKSNQSSGQDS